MKLQPYISIVICVYNGDKTLKSAIESLLRQRYPKNKYEILLIDDGSSDLSKIICLETLNKCQENSPLIKYAYQKNRGLGSARNIGIHLSEGDYIAFMDQDAVANEDWLSHLVTGFNGNEKIGVVGGKIKILNKNSWFANFIHWTHYYMEDKSGNEIIPIVGTNMAFRKSVFKKVGGFFENFRAFGDETSFINVKLKSYFKKSTSNNAIVLHERPWDLKQWCRERIFNGQEYALEKSIAKRYHSIAKYNCIYNLYRICSVTLPIFIILGLLFELKTLLVISISIGIIILYRCFIRDNIYVRTKILVRNYGNIMGICLIPLYIIISIAGKLFDDYGFIKGLYKYKSVAIKDTISIDKVETIITNI